MKMSRQEFISLSAKAVDTGGLGHSPCQITGGSSLAQTGRGGFAPLAANLLGPSSGFAAGGSPVGSLGIPVSLGLASTSGSLAGKCLF